MRVTLKDDGYPSFKKIMQGKRWIGRVIRTADGRYYGRIGKTEAYALSENQAFHEVAARWFGHDSAADLDAANAEVRAVQREQRAIRREQRARIQPAIDAMRRGDFKAVFEELDKAVDRDNARTEK